VRVMVEGISVTAIKDVFEFMEALVDGSMTVRVELEDPRETWNESGL
jgi:hypothetical protein